ncbi:MAG: glycosyl hydrolase [Gammaproteobacteria bacterium]|mgnify:FL=1|nr:glycosyl hydrolase [Gammaproteobacteria bacterium]MBP17936.1 glycosyl hydrolase [Gammaproteobacteria bacterium]
MTDTDLDAILEKMALAEKVMIVSGASAWRTHPVESVGIPVLKVSDGPNGVRGDGGVSAASFPVGICLASTWNAELIEQLGKAVAEEAKSKDVQVVLGPTINIHRTPLAGRDFECYSEDPFLSGILAAAFTTGVQKEGVGACVKHFVCNDSEFERHTISTEVDERTLREIYLRPFEIAIKRSRPWTVMASYNRINGVYACSHDYLVNQVLKGEWQYDGLVISDWFAAKETVANALGGLDLEMPGPTRVWGDALLEAVNEGTVPVTTVDDKVRRLLRVIDRSGRFENPDEQAEQALDKPDHKKIAYQAAAEGMVLLKNAGILPLPNIGRLAVIGPNTHDFRIMGGGSSSLKPHYIATPLDALTGKVSGIEVTTAVGCRTHKYVPAPDRRWLSPDGESSERGLRCRFYAEEIGSELVEERVIAPSTIRAGRIAADISAKSMLITGFLTPEESGEHEFGLLSTGRARLYLDEQLIVDNWQQPEVGVAFFGQGTTERRGVADLVANQPRAIKVEFESTESSDQRIVRYGVLPPQPEDSIGDAVGIAAEADTVLLLVGTSDDWETEGNDREMLELPGEQNELIRRVISANPNTVVVNNSGSPVAMPWIDEAPAVIQSWFAGQEFGNALVDILLGHVNPSGKLPITFPKRLQDTPAFTNYPGESGKVHYGEGVFVGYRWYDTRDIDPLLAFGHGLSYTSFEYKELSTGEYDSGLDIFFKITNTGDRDGKETAQVYIEPLDSPVARPTRELKAFVKIDIKAKEQQMVSVHIDREGFAHWDVTTSGWVVTPGRYLVHVGSSSRDLRLVKEVDISD